MCMLVMISDFQDYNYKIIMCFCIEKTYVRFIILEKSHFAIGP